MKNRRITSGVMIALSVAGVWAAAVYATRAVAATSPSSAFSSTDRFRFHEELVKAQKSVWDFQSRMNSTGVPADTRDLFHKWARLIYEDSLRVGINRLPAGDPLAKELGAALLTDGEPRSEMVLKANLGPIPSSRITTLLARVADLQGHHDSPWTGWVASEFEWLFKKAKQRSDGFYMSEMKDLLVSQEPLEKKIDFVMRFVAIGDARMADYPREYFDELLKTQSLESNQRVKIQALLNEINKLMGK
ncbi:MAG: hypothetical protein IPP35_07050 [Elusimicrobia bacterium]|nr:hypothetical protein [Elusimicrobiota bacterium]